MNRNCDSLGIGPPLDPRSAAASKQRRRQRGKKGASYPDWADRHGEAAEEEEEGEDEEGRRRRRHRGARRQLLPSYPPYKVGNAATFTGSRGTELPA